MLGLKHFILKSEGRKLYRDVLRAIKGLDVETAAGVREAAREQFYSNAHVTDTECARFCIELLFLPCSLHKNASTLAETCFVKLYSDTFDAC